MLLVLAIACAMAFAVPTAVAGRERRRRRLPTRGTAPADAPARRAQRRPAPAAAAPATAAPTHASGPVPSEGVRLGRCSPRSRFRDDGARVRIASHRDATRSTTARATCACDSRSCSEGRGALRRYNLGRRRTGSSQTFTAARGRRKEDDAGGDATSSASRRVDPDGNRLVRSSRTIAGRPRPRHRRSSRPPLPGARRAQLRRRGLPLRSQRAAATRHQGQDITAAEGTPVVAPRARRRSPGAPTRRAAPATTSCSRATTSPTTTSSCTSSRAACWSRKGDRVHTGQQIGERRQHRRVRGPHLHFEIWDGPWYNGGKPIDPLPLLAAWDAVFLSASASRHL